MPQEPPTRSTSPSRANSPRHGRISAAPTAQFTPTASGCTLRRLCKSTETVWLEDIPAGGAAGGRLGRRQRAVCVARNRDLGRVGQEAGQALGRDELPDAPVLSVNSVSTAREPARQIRHQGKDDAWPSASGHALQPPDEAAVRGFAQSPYRGSARRVEVQRLAKPRCRLGIARESGERADIWAVRFDDALAARISVDARSRQYTAARDEVWALHDFLSLVPAVGRARAGRHRVGWQGATTLRAHAHEEEQRSQHARGRLDRVRSVLTRKVMEVVSPKSSIHTVQPAEMSGQLPDLGSVACTSWTTALARTSTLRRCAARSSPPSHSSRAVSGC